jgi:hypothetical protein
MADLSKPLATSNRLPLREPPYEPEVQKRIDNAAFSGLSPQNLRVALAHHSVLGGAFQAMAHAVLFKCALPERVREIAIIRTGGAHTLGMRMGHICEHLRAKMRVGRTRNSPS